MRIIDYDRAIEEMLENSVNPETGELELNEELLMQLQMEKEAKVEGLILAYKNELALATAIKSEMEELKARADSHSKKADSLKDFISYVLDGHPFETSKVKVSYRNSESVEVTKDYDWSKLKEQPFVKTTTEYKPDKTVLKKLIKGGETFEFAELVSKKNIQIK